MSRRRSWRSAHIAEKNRRDRATAHLSGGMARTFARFGIDIDGFLLPPQDRFNRGQGTPEGQSIPLAETEARQPSAEDSPKSPKVRRMKPKAEAMFPWRKLWRRILRSHAGAITKSELGVIVAELGIPKRYADLIFYCTKTYQKLKGSQAKTVRAARMCELLTKFHSVLFSFGVWEAVKRGYGPKVRAQMRRWVEKNRRVSRTISRQNSK